ncbi:hypothetical protein C8J56DRAFT_955235 [Mycena floridula]|nr:hypothetical protein C8J56DRAFT_955235 [Mycena floridula]
MMLGRNIGKLYSTAAVAAIPRQYPYFIPRNGNKSLPVYSDVRGERYIVLIRNIDGKTEELAKEMQQSLFSSPEYSRLKFEIHRSRNIRISGASIKERRAVTEWLLNKGF